MLQVILDVETKKTFEDVGGFFPERLGISFVGVCIRNNFYEPGEFQSYFERDIPKLFPLLEKADVVVGFNIDNFDMPTFTSYYAGNITKIPTLDVMKRIQDSIGHRISLNAVAQETLGEGKSGDGLDAIKYYNNQDREKLERFCYQDVKVTRDVLDYGYKHGTVKFRNKWNRLIECPIDFSFTAKKDAGVQMALL